MRLVRNGSEDEAWEVGGIKYKELISQPYSNCVFSAGSVEGAGVDVLYLRWQRGEEGGMLLLRPDEVAAIAWVMSGVLWSYELASVPNEVAA